MTINTDIFLGSGASITKIPEFDIIFPSTKVGGSAFNNVSLGAIQATTAFSTPFSLVNNLYVGCLLEMYTGTTLKSTHRIKANTENTITFTPNATPVDANDFFVIKSYGAPCPAPKVAGATAVLAQPSITTAGTQIEADESVIINTAITGVSGLTSTGAEIVLTLSAESSTVTFPAEATNYNSGFLTIKLASPSGTNGVTTLDVLFDARSATVATSTGEDSVTVLIQNGATGAEIAQSVLIALNGKDVTVSRSGAILTITNNTGGFVGAAHITETTTTATTETMGSVLGGIITAVTVTNAGSSVSGSGNLTITSNSGTDGVLALAATTVTTAKRLLSDEWLGIVESVSFPTTEIETKQVNLSLGTTRNKSYQYKGIETASGGNLSLVTTQGTWLYYFFGAMESISATTIASSPSDDFTATSGKKYITTGTLPSTGPFFHRTAGTTGAGETGTVLCPPNPDHLQAHTVLKELTPSAGTTTMTQPITYTIAEENGDNLPSFAMEQTLSKLEGTNKFRTDSTETLESMNFVKIARGCRVNTLSLTANENEEVKMTLDVNTRAVHALETDESYDGRRGIEDNTLLNNYSSTTEFREPFFYSGGTFSIFGQSFLKINTLTLTMNNNLQDRRFLGVGNNSIQEAIPAERTYELQFTGHVTDDRLYQELLNRTENALSDGAADATEISLTFEKPNGESIALKFRDYMVSANNFPIPDDKGALVVETTVLPRTMTSCVVKTHWTI